MADVAEQEWVDHKRLLARCKILEYTRKWHLTNSMIHAPRIDIRNEASQIVLIPFVLTKKPAFAGITQPIFAPHLLVFRYCNWGFKAFAGDKLILVTE